jgi:hypothetical protein
MGTQFTAWSRAWLLIWKWIENKWNQGPGGHISTLEVTWSLVGASLLAMDVNDNACELDKRGALESIAGKPAPTVWRSHHFDWNTIPVGAGL